MLQEDLSARTKNNNNIRQKVLKMISKKHIVISSSLFPAPEPEKRENTPEWRILGKGRQVRAPK